jgi:iron complex transport system ATP-binding protein
MIIMTPDLVVQDEPCNLISKGSFSTLFKDEHIIFDVEKGKFIVT